LIAEAKKSLSFNELCYHVIANQHLLPQRINVLSRLHTARQYTPGKMCILAEIKRTSPSGGNINMNIDVVKQALEYAAGGAAGISVLCEPKWFKGSLNDLHAIRQALNGVPNRPALLLKDFVEDEYQLVEGRAAGADTALLIVASLGADKLRHLMYVCRSLDMEPLVEVANEAEMRVALDHGAIFIGLYISLDSIVY
jgi:indole-3-glycerol phosphate synthase